jgi:hypothetical protein
MHTTACGSTTIYTLTGWYLGPGTRWVLGCGGATRGPSHMSIRVTYPTLQPIPAGGLDQRPPRGVGMVLRACLVGGRGIQAVPATVVVPLATFTSADYFSVFPVGIYTSRLETCLPRCRTTSVGC